MSVTPEYQRRGLGSRLLQWFCEETDRYHRWAYALASPEGVALYQRFGFETVGTVLTSKGPITSMLRKPLGAVAAP